MLLQHFCLNFFFVNREIDLGAEIILSMEDKSVKIVNKKVSMMLSFSTLQRKKQSKR